MVLGLSVWSDQPVSYENDPMDVDDGDNWGQGKPDSWLGYVWHSASLILHRCGRVRQVEALAFSRALLSRETAMKMGAPKARNP